MGNSKKITVTVRQVPESLWKRVKFYAVKRDRSIQSVVVEALGQYMKGK